MLFGLYDAPECVPEVLNPFIVIEWTQLRLLGLKMLSVGLLPTHSDPNMSIRKLYMTIQRTSQQPMPASGWLGFTAPEDLRSCLAI